MPDAFATAFDEAEKQYNDSSFKSAFDEAESEWNQSAPKTVPSGDFFKERFKVGALDVPEKPPTTLSELPVAVAEEAKGLAGTLVRPVTTLEKGVAAALAEAGILTPKQYAKTWHTIDQPLRIPTLPKAESMAGKISSGVASAAIDFVNAFIDPDAIALIGLGGVPGATQKVILGTFAAEMATAAPQQLQAATEAAKRGDWQEAVRQTTGGIGGTMLSAHLARKTIEPAGGVRAMSPETAALIPETAKAAGIQIEPAPVPIKVEPPIVPPTRETVVPTVQTELEVPKPELQPATPELKPAEVVPPVEKGVERALQERISTAVPVEVPPVSSEAVGAQVREPERPTVPRPEAEREAPKAPPAELTPEIDKLRLKYDQQRKSVESFRDLLLREAKRDADFNTAISAREKDAAIQSALRSSRASTDTKNAYRTALRRFTETERALEERLATEKQGEFRGVSGRINTEGRGLPPEQERPEPTGEPIPPAEVKPSLGWGTAIKDDGTGRYTDLRQDVAVGDYVQGMRYSPEGQMNIQEFGKVVKVLKGALDIERPDGTTTRITSHLSKYSRPEDLAAATKAFELMAGQVKSAEPGPSVSRSELIVPILHVKEGKRLIQVTPKQASEMMDSLVRKSGLGSSKLGPLKLYDINGNEIAFVSYNGNVWMGDFKKPSSSSELLYNATGLVKNERGVWDIPKGIMWEELTQIQDKLATIEKKYDYDAVTAAVENPEYRELIVQRNRILDARHGKGKPIAVESTVSKVYEARRTPPTEPLVGLGAAEKTEIPEQPQGAARILENVTAKEAQSEKTAAKMEGKVKLAVEYDIDKLDEEFKIFDEEIGDALTTGGQFLLKKRRPLVAKGAPAEPETVTSKQVNQYFTSKLSTLVNEMRRVRSELAQQASPEHAAYLDLIVERAQHTFRQVQELRRASHESLAFWNKIKAEMMDIKTSLGIMGDLKRRLPILDSLWKNLRERKYRWAGKDFLEFLRVNLFTLGSWTLDFATNLAVASTKLPAFAMGDMVSLMRGNSASRMAAALQSARMSAKNLVPGERFRLPQEVETRLGTVAGSEFQGYGKEVMVDFSEILKGKPDAAEQLKKIDILLSAPVRMKRATDNFFGRMGAATELYHGAYEAAKKAGLKGEDMQTFVENYVKTPPKEAIEAAVKEGKEWKFNRDLSEWEEKFAANTITKLAIEAFPRWTLQFSRWAGEMLGLNPTLYRKIKEGRATQQEVIDGLTKAATGWGGIVLFNNLVYDNIDAETMEYVKEDGDRVRLSGRTPAPELFFITALLRGDFQKAKAALPQTSIPLAKLLGGEPGGIVSPVVDAMRESVRGRYTAERTVGELTKLINNAIPGKSVLGFIRSLYDPTIREGLGAPIPGVAGLLPQKIEPTTGEPAAPKQKIPGTSFTFPTVGGTPFPGAVRDLNAIQAVLMNHGLAVTRPRRTSIIELPAEDVPKEYRREYEKLAGQNVKRILGEAIVQPDFWQSPPEIRRKLLQNWLNIARSEARNAMAEKYHTGTKPVKSPPIRVELMPERFKPSTQPK